MANWIRFLPTLASEHVGPSSRYIRHKLLHYTEEKKIAFEIYKRPNRPMAGNEEWLEITEAVQYRPDLVSEEIYGTPDFWWSIMEFNGMKDILEFKAGTNIRIPGDVMA